MTDKIDRELTRYNDHIAELREGGLRSSDLLVRMMLEAALLPPDLKRQVAATLATFGDFGDAPRNAIGDLVESGARQLVAMADAERPPRWPVVRPAYEYDAMVVRHARKNVDHVVGSLAMKQRRPAQKMGNLLDALYYCASQFPNEQAGRRAGGLLRELTGLDPYSTD